MRRFAGLLVLAGATSLSCSSDDGDPVGTGNASGAVAGQSAGGSAGSASGGVAGTGRAGETSGGAGRGGGGAGNAGRGGESSGGTPSGGQGGAAGLGATGGDGNGGVTSGGAGGVGGGSGAGAAGAGAGGGAAGTGAAGAGTAGAGAAGNGGGGGTGGTGSTSCDDPLAVGDTSRFTAADSLETYSISGDTADELRASLNQNRGMDYDAYTSWTIQWTYDNCSDPTWSMTLAISYIMPEWDPPPGADPTLVDRWWSYIDALYCHEYGHGDLAIDCANNLLDALEQIPGTSDCGALLDTANQVTESVIADCNDADIEYDDATNHGATMGAVFP